MNNPNSPNLNGDFILLSEISKNYGIKGNYLRILVFRKKLKAIKFGNAWVTKKEWLEECLENIKNRKKVNGENKNIANAENSNGIITGVKDGNGDITEYTSAINSGINIPPPRASQRAC